MTKTETRPDLHSFVARGAQAGIRLLPHKHRDGSYVVSMTRFERDDIRVTDGADLIGWLEKGYRLRMSNKDCGVPSPSLIEPGAIYRPICL